MPVFNILVENGNDSHFDMVRAVYLQQTIEDVKLAALASLGSTKDKCKIQEVLKMVISDEVRAQDLTTPLETIGDCGHGRLELWEFIESNWKLLEKLLGDGLGMLIRALEYGTQFSDEKMAERIMKFFENQDRSKVERAVQQCLERIRVNIDWRRKVTDSIEKWANSTK